MIFITAGHGGMFRETYAMSKAYVEAPHPTWRNELVDEIVSAKPAMDQTRYESPSQLR
jgi:hypothetical protein